MNAAKKFAESALPRLEADPRLLGLAAAGSWLSGEMDDFSDLDLIVVYDSGRENSVKADMNAIADTLGPCLARFPADHLGLPNLLICLFDDPLLHVDLNFVSLDEFSRRTENPAVLWERNGALTKVIEESKPNIPHLDLQWIEDRFWTWLHYGAQRLGRGEIFEVLSTLSFLRDKALGPMASTKVGRPPWGVRKIEKFGEPEDLAELRETAAPYDARACEKALRAAAKTYVGLREDLDPGSLKRNRRAEMAALRTLHEVSEKL